MIAAAYRYASGEVGAECPAELVLLQMVDRLGAQAVFGRPLKRSEINSMMMAEKVANSYIAMTTAEDMDKWIREHEEEWKMLDHAAGLVKNDQ